MNQLGEVDAENEQNLPDLQMDPTLELKQEHNNVNEYTYQQLKHQNEKYEKEIQNLEMQNKQLIKEHNESVLKLMGDLYEQVKRNEALIEKKSKQMEQHELHSNKQIADLQSQLGETKLMDFMLSSNCNQNKDEAEVLLHQLHSKTEITSNNASDEEKDVIVFDIPTFFCCIFRFIYAIIVSAEITNGQIKSNYVTAAVAFCLSILFEVFSDNLNGAFKKIFTAYGIGGIIYWVSSSISFSQSTRFFLPFLMGGTIMMISEIYLVIQMQKKSMPNLLILSHACHIVTTSFGMISNTSKFTQYLIALFLMLHFIFMLFGLPIKISKVKEDDNHNSLTQTSNVEHESETNLSIIENENENENESDEIMELISDSTNNKSITDIILQMNHRLDSLESQITKPTNHFIFSGLNLKGSNTNWTTQAHLSPDVYTMMILSHWTEITFYNPFNRCTKNPTLIEIPRPSKSWMLGIVVFLFQTSLALLTLLDQIAVDDGDTPLNIPFQVSSVVRIGQFITLILSVMTQSDVLVSYRIVLFLRYKKRGWRKLIGYEKNERSLSVWLGRIFLPNFMKAFQGLLVLVTTFIVIVQSDNIVDLLKDFTALFVISSIDDMFFFMADHGYLGPSLSKKTDKAKKILIDEDDHKIHRHLYLFLFIILFFIFGGWVTVVAQQLTVSFLKKVYPRCPPNVDVDLIGDGKCNFAKNMESNILQCGWEGGDCDDFNFRYPNCTGEFKPILVGDGKCDFLKGSGANKVECSWEGGDCDTFNVRYPNCTVEFPYLIGDGECLGLYNWEVCGFDGGDCDELNSELLELYPNCTGGIQPELIGNGRCDANYDREECGFDGSDCIPISIIPPSRNPYPNCTVPFPEFIGDGHCHGGEYVTEECGFDGGDCANCTVDTLLRLGNGRCDGDLYNTKECGFDGGDCTTLNYPNCSVDSPFRIGDGYCDGGLYNTAECGFDGEDCLEYNAKYPNCTAENPMLVGDGICHNSYPYNTNECKFDGGDCEK